MTTRVGDTSRFRRDLAPVANEYGLVVAKVRTQWQRKVDAKGSPSYDRQVVVTLVADDGALELPLTGEDGS